MTKAKSAGKTIKKASKMVKRIIPKKSFEDNKRNILYLVIHCAASPPSMEVGRERIKKWHIDRGFNDIGYHFLIGRDGSVEVGREMKTTGAHVQGHNSNSIGICWIGGVKEVTHEPHDNRTLEQKDTLEQLLIELLKQYPESEIMGHRDFKGVKKACPSFDVKDWCDLRGIK